MAPPLTPTRMETHDTTDNWFEKETAVFFKLCWVPLALLLLDLLVAYCLRTSVGELLYCTIPWLTFFASGVTTVWGLALICLGFRKRKSVIALAASTIASSVPLLFLLGMFLLAPSPSFPHSGRVLEWW